MEEGMHQPHFFSSLPLASYMDMQCTQDDTSLKFRVPGTEKYWGDHGQREKKYWESNCVKCFMEVCINLWAHMHETDYINQNETLKSEVTHKHPPYHETWICIQDRSM